MYASSDSLNLATCPCIRTSSISLYRWYLSNIIYILFPLFLSCLHFLIPYARAILPSLTHFHSFYYLPYSYQTATPLSFFPFYPSSPSRLADTIEGSAEDRAHWQARVAVTYCLLMECDKSCGNAGVRGSHSRGVEYVSVPLCVCVCERACVRACACVRVCPYVFLPFVSMPACVFVQNVLVWGRRAWLRPFTAHLAQIGPPGWWGSSAGRPWHSGAPLTATKYRGSISLLINTAALTNHHNYDLMRGGERNERKERGRHNGGGIGGIRSI